MRSNTTHRDGERHSSRALLAASISIAAALSLGASTASGAETSTRAAAAEAIQKAGCGGCHAIPRVPGASGRVGPDLSVIGAVAAERRPGMSAEEYIRESILDPDAFLAPECPIGACPPGVMLQSFADTLSPAELDAIVAYFLTLGTVEHEETAPRQISIPTTLSDESHGPLWPGAPPRAEAAPEKVALGKLLFFDTRLSGNRSLACSSCHQPEQAWSDGRRFPKSYPETAYFRNTPTLLDAAGREQLFWDGRLDGQDFPTLVRDHMTEAHFMNADGRLVAERLRQVPPYAERFTEIYGEEPRFGAILDAVAAYVETLGSGPTPWDAYRTGSEDALGGSARRGLALFEGKAGCTGCHTGPQLHDGEFHDIGVRSDADALSEPLRAVTFRRFLRVLGTPNYRNVTSDPGRFAVTKKRPDLYRFRTPGLRNVARMAPYMHDGSRATLEEVVDFYDAGAGPDNRAGLEPLGLSHAEKKDLVEFLRSGLASDLVVAQVPALPSYALVPLPEPPHVSNDAEPSAEEPAPARTDPAPLGVLPPPQGPPDNPITPEKRELGRILFFDPRMSGDGSLSCASCHPPATGWSSTAPISFGYPGTVHWRHAQTVLNVAYYYALNWDGAARSIEGQNKGAWTGAVAGNLDPVMAEERLAQIPEYVERFREVFGTEVPRFDDALRAVATYQRTLVSKNVPLDAYLDGDEEAISAEARRGHDLFEGKAGCIGCHNGPLLSDQSFYALGAPMHEDFFSNPLRQITFRWETWIKGADEEGYRTASEDYGLFFVTKQESDKGKFRTPGLRDICYTGPYMHNGVLETLDDVVRFYDGGGGPHPNKDARIRPLGLSEQERSDLVRFLETLCGDRVEDRAPELPPYASGLVRAEDSR